MATVRKGLPEVWVTTAAQWLVGEMTCPYRGFFKAHHSRYEKTPNDFDSVAWKAGHTALVNATVQQMEADGWKCRVEGYTRVTGKTAILAGKPDIVGQRHGVTKVVDCKSGEPKESHAAQVAIYMIVLPMAWQAPKLHVVGEVVYKPPTAPVIVEPHQALELRERLFEAMRFFASEGSKKAQPSEFGCRWCDITSMDCPDWMDHAPLPALTEVF